MRGRLLLLDQFAALYIKNALVAWRARRATILRLLAPLLFLLLALLIDKAIQADNSNTSYFSDVKRPDTEAVAPIPSCREDVYIGNRDCLELTYSPDNSITQAIMGNVIARNPKPIQARAFPSRQAVQQFLLDNPDYTIGAVHFVFDDDTSPAAQLQGFVIQTNTSIKVFKSNTQDLNKFVQLPLQSAVHREIARYNLAKNPATSSLADQLSWFIGLKVFPHPSISTFSVLGRVLGPFIFAACMFSFVTQISAVVMEKEMGVRQAMRTMGMTESAYWLSWGAWEVTMAFLSGHLIACFGLLMQFDLFLDNNYGLMFFLFFLFQLAMSSLALLCSTFMNRTQTAVYIGFLIFIVGWIMQTVVIFGVPYTPDNWTTSPLNYAITVIFSAFPWNLLMKGFQDLGAATVGDNPGLRWQDRKLYCQNIPSLDAQDRWAQDHNYNPRDQYVDFKCVMPLDTIYRVLLILWAGFLVLAIYLDNVLKNEFGVRRPLLYFLYPSYWLPFTLTPRTALSHVLKEDHIGPDDEGAKDEDVLAEEARMRQLLNHRTGHTSKEGELAAAVDVRNAIEVYGLKKKYGGSTGCCGHSLVCCDPCSCCSCSASESFWPIKGSWLAIEQDQLFCLLGPNGAGKTTTINCLTGVLPPTAGDALVYGQSIRSTGGMDKVRGIMGVCPQFDVLWPELSGREHLCLYGRIKGCGWKNSVIQADTLLDKVKLTYAALQRTGAYSGGMKRRLSVAIALLGDPKIVYLDEPTTGMDPISRRYVWDIIQEAKVGRAIVLTTHSMEEADILGDRIAIMALGRLRCLGTSLRLKQRFGSGYQVAVSVQPGAGVPVEPAVTAQRDAVVDELFKQRLGLVPTDKGRSYTTYVVPREREPDLVPFLSELEARAAQLGLTDIQLSLTSLEEVFLNIARTAALESAQSRPVVPRKKPLPFCSTCLKVTLLAATLPVSICFVCCWPRFLRGRKPKDEEGLVATLPDGTTLPVTPGQEYVQDASGRVWQVQWGVDDSGNLVVQETQLAPAGVSATAAAAGVMAGGGEAGQSSQVCIPAVDGKARVPLPGNVLMEVRVGDSYVMNPVDGATYHISWGAGPQGQPTVLGYTRADRAPTPQAFTYNPVHNVHPTSASGNGIPVAPPVDGGRSTPSGQPSQQAAAAAAGGGSRPGSRGPVSESSTSHTSLLPGSVNQ